MAVPIFKLKTETMLRKISLSIIAGLTLSSAMAQDSTATKSWNLTGSVDAYYRFNFGNPKSDATDAPALSDFSPYNNYTSFTNSQNSFELGMASLKVEHSMGKVGVVADLGFGKRAEEFS
jgi:putative salt-induced outer membrane protein YdiY